MRGILLFLVCFIISSDAGAQPNPWHRPARPGINAHSRAYANTYGLSNRVFLKWTPSALMRFPESMLRLGGEYCFAKRFGFGLEGGPVFGRPRNLTNSRATGGWDIHAEPRIYYGLRKSGRGFAGIQGFYRTMNYDSGYTSALDKYSDITNFVQSSAHARIMGIGMVAGYMFHLGSGLHLELSTGLGSKNVHVDREITGPRSSPQGTSALFINEREVLNDYSMPYLILELKFSGLLGGYKRMGAH